MISRHNRQRLEAFKQGNDMATFRKNKTIINFTKSYHIYQCFKVSQFNRLIVWHIDLIDWALQVFNSACSMRVSWRYIKVESAWLPEKPSADKNVYWRLIIDKDNLKQEPNHQNRTKQLQLMQKCEGWFKSSGKLTRRVDLPLFGR